MRALRIVAAIVAGMIVAMILVIAVETASEQVYPLPAGLNPADPAQMRTHVATLPAGAFAFVLAAWFVGTAAGAWLATRLARSPIAGFVVGVLLLTAGVANMLFIPHPVWFWAASIAIFVTTTFYATRIGQSGGSSGRTDVNRAI